MPTPKRITVLISGSGSNLQAVIDAIDSGQINGRIERVICNQPEAYGLTRAANAGIDTVLINHRDYDGRESFDAALIEAIDASTADLIVLAGFMRIFTDDFVIRYQDRMLNVHPSLLPKYKGLNTHQRAIEDGESHGGCSVHFVTPELDGGPVVLQGAVAIEPSDDASALQQRVHRMEHIIYPKVVEWFCAERLSWSAGQILFDGEPLPAGGFTQQSL